MSKIENLASQLCDELMIATKTGNMTDIKTVVVMLIEFSAIELMRHEHSEAASFLVHVTNEVKTAFGVHDPSHQ